MFPSASALGKNGFLHCFGDLPNPLPAVKPTAALTVSASRHANPPSRDEPLSQEQPLSGAAAAVTRGPAAARQPPREFQAVEVERALFTQPTLPCWERPEVTDISVTRLTLSAGLPSHRSKPVLRRAIAAPRASLRTPGYTARSRHNPRLLPPPGFAKISPKPNLMAWLLHHAGV